MRALVVRQLQIRVPGLLDVVGRKVELRRRGAVLRNEVGGHSIELLRRERQIRVI